MILALILFVGVPPNITATRVGVYRNVDECNRRVVEMRRLPHVRDAVCLPVDE